MPPSTAAPVVIEVRDLHKTFRLPTREPTTLRARLGRPLRAAPSRELRAWRGVSFEVRGGEFFGVVGRNGSGKSTLLKVLASIYRADAGRVRMAGRLAPFIELGVGFNVELTARENVALNGVMLGLGRREAGRRLASVLEFAELSEFVDLKLKNYSSGMLVRLAFAVMVESDADIMLVDEVLAVGDASFAQKCLDVFREKRRVGKTLVLVTHDMATVQGFCDRAMLIHDGELRYVGDPEETALRYYRLNFPGSSAAGADGDDDLVLVDAWLETQEGTRTEAVDHGAPFGLQLVVEARREVSAPIFGFQVLNVAEQAVFGFGTRISADAEAPVIPAGGRVRVRARVENPLVPGTDTVNGIVSREGTQADVALRLPALVEFAVRGPHGASAAIDEHEVGMVTAREDIRAVVERA